MCHALNFYEKASEISSAFSTLGMVTSDTEGINSTASNNPVTTAPGAPDMTEPFGKSDVEELLYNPSPFPQTEKEGTPNSKYLVHKTLKNFETRNLIQFVAG